MTLLEQVELAARRLAAEYGTRVARAPSAEQKTICAALSLAFNEFADQVRKAQKVVDASKPGSPE